MLPVPSADALAHSQRVTAHLRALIEDAGGWIPFSRYMEAALYTPGLGYYAAGAMKFGAAGDFVTAPEMTPLFGRTLAHAIAPVLMETGGEVLELGAGSGRLAADLLGELDRLGALPARYCILEVSADLRQRQQETMAREQPQLAGRVQWLDALPDTFQWRDPRQRGARRAAGRTGALDRSRAAGARRGARRRCLRLAGPVHRRPRSACPRRRAGALAGLCFRNQSGCRRADRLARTVSGPRPDPDDRLRIQRK